MEVSSKTYTTKRTGTGNGQKTKLDTATILRIIGIFLSLQNLATECSSNNRVRGEGSGPGRHYPPRLPEFSPERLLALAPESRPTPEHGDVYFRRCNQTKYNETLYKKSWDLASNYNFQKSVELFEDYIQIERKGQSPQWRQEVCDGWPFSLFQCSMHPRKKFNVCQCLKTPLSEFVVELVKLDVDRDDEADLEIKVCRVTEGNACSEATYSLKCAKDQDCISGKCHAAQLASTIVLVSGAYLLNVL